MVESVLVRILQSLIQLSVAAVLFLGACAAEPVALSQLEISNALVAQGVDIEVASCAAGLEITEAPTQDLLNSERLAKHIDDCVESQIGIAQLEAERQELTVLAFADPQNYGDDAELDLLWDDCAAGSGKACDKLFAESPISSEYEKFGLSCGERLEVLDCEELDAEDEIQPIPEIAVVTTTTTVVAEDAPAPQQAAQTN